MEWIEIYREDYTIKELFQVFHFPRLTYYCSKKKVKSDENAKLTYLISKIWLENKFRWGYRKSDDYSKSNTKGKC